jgi:hypothetical protein
LAEFELRFAAMLATESLVVVLVGLAEVLGQ